ncbi:Fur family transcriptional regulator [Cellulomonas citrea]|uniref:Fur family transcriptional regulator n=1 Tax=Cellulomonas citrea TaxID=1909423 RepID=UPI001F2A547A|nr:Fur family transcriptional regulator [Cellulomonas citrea]
MTGSAPAEHRHPHLDEHPHPHRHPDPSTVTHPADGPVGAPPPDPDEVAALVEQVGDRLRAHGERMTTPRRAVLTALARSGGHVLAAEVVTAVAEVDPTVHRASVYRTLEALSELGVVQHLHLGHGGTAYHLARGGHTHLHAQCRVCGAVLDLPAELLDDVARVLESRDGFTLDPGHVALSGTCARCAVG